LLYWQDYNIGSLLSHGNICTVTGIDFNNKNISNINSIDCSNNSSILIGNTSAQNIIMGNNNCSTIVRGTLNISSLQLNGQFGAAGQIISTNGKGPLYWDNIYNTTNINTSYVDSTITYGSLYIGTKNTSNIYLGNMINASLFLNSSNIILSRPLTPVYTIAPKSNQIGHVPNGKGTGTTLTANTIVTVDTVILSIGTWLIISKINITPSTGSLSLYTYSISDTINVLDKTCATSSSSQKATTPIVTIMINRLVQATINNTKYYIVFYTSQPMVLSSATRWIRIS
jgi:hypothetical protein